MLRHIREVLHALPSGRTAVRVFCQLTSISAPLGASAAQRIPFSISSNGTGSEDMNRTDSPGCHLFDKLPRSPQLFSGGYAFENQRNVFMRFHTINLTARRSSAVCDSLRAPERSSSASLRARDGDSNAVPMSWRRPSTSPSEKWRRAGLHRESAMRRRIERALRRITDLSFGVCVHCGKEVKRRRLETVPWTPFCVRCQESRPIAATRVFSNPVDVSRCGVILSL